MERRDYRPLAIIAFSIAVLVCAWLSDDAYHAYVMAKNLADGNGIVYNIGYRVNVSTCPFYTLLTSIFYMVFNESMYIAGIVQGVVFSTIAFGILLYKSGNNKPRVFLILISMLGCYEFMSYTTSGLENSLLYLLCALFLSTFLDDKEWNVKRLFWLFFVHSLILITRMDNTLIYIVPLVYVFFFVCRIPFIKKCIIAILGTLPFIIWEVFSFWYFGAFFPNTVYVKIFTGISKAEYFRKGIDYLWRSYSADGFILLCILTYVLLAILKYRNVKHMCVAAGLLIYHIYIISIGGDFMLGRFIAVSYYASIFGICNLSCNHFVSECECINLFGIKKGTIGIMPIICVIGLLWRVIISPAVLNELYDIHWDESITSVADEKRYYYPITGLFPCVMENRITDNWMMTRHYSECIDEIDSAIKNGQKGLITEGVLAGMVRYYYLEKNPGFYLTDACALMDPLLSHLPANKTNPWRVGHLRRSIPCGYTESIMATKNTIEDGNLWQYYDVILRVVSGDLKDHRRINEIWNLNIGAYDYLVDYYLSEH